MTDKELREGFEKFWPSVGQNMCKSTAFETWKAAIASQAQQENCKHPEAIPICVGEGTWEAHCPNCNKLIVVQQLSEQDKRDAERLNFLESEAKASSTGISITYGKHAEHGYVLEKGYRFMRRGLSTDFKPTAREAIDAAIAARTQGKAS
jgi:hypothetical protein